MRDEGVAQLFSRVHAGKASVPGPRLHPSKASVSFTSAVDALVADPTQRSEAGVSNPYRPAWRTLWTSRTTVHRVGGTRRPFRRTSHSGRSSVHVSSFDSSFLLADPREARNPSLAWPDAGRCSASTRRRTRRRDVRFEVFPGPSTCADWQETTLGRFWSIVRTERWRRIDPTEELVDAGAPTEAVQSSCSDACDRSGHASIVGCPRPPFRTRCAVLRVQRKASAGAREWPSQADPWIPRSRWFHVLLKRDPPPVVGRSRTTPPFPSWGRCFVIPRPDRRGERRRRRLARGAFRRRKEEAFRWKNELLWTRTWRGTRRST